MVLTGNLVGNIIFFVIPMLVMSILSGFGIEIFKSGDEYYTGIKAFLTGTVVAVFWILWTAFWSVCISLGFYIGLWVYSKFKPFPIYYKPLPNNTLKPTPTSGAA